MVHQVNVDAFVISIERTLSKGHIWIGHQDLLLILQFLPTSLRFPHSAKSQAGRSILTNPSTLVNKKNLNTSTCTKVYQPNQYVKIFQKLIANNENILPQIHNRFAYIHSKERERVPQPNDLGKDNVNQQSMTRGSWGPTFFFMVFTFPDKLGSVYPCICQVGRGSNFLALNQQPAAQQSNTLTTTEPIPTTTNY